MLILSSSLVIVSGVWLVSLGVLAIGNELIIGLGAIGAGLFLTGSGVVALVAGSWEPLKDIFDYIRY